MECFGIVKPHFKKNFVEICFIEPSLKHRMPSQESVRQVYCTKSRVLPNKEHKKKYNKYSMRMNRTIYFLMRRKKLARLLRKSLAAIVRYIQYSLTRLDDFL